MKKERSNYRHSEYRYNYQLITSFSAACPRFLAQSIYFLLVRGVGVFYGLLCLMLQRIEMIEFQHTIQILDVWGNRSSLSYLSLLWVFSKNVFYHTYFTTSFELWNALSCFYNCWINLQTFERKNCPDMTILFSSPTSSFLSCVFLSSSAFYIVLLNHVYYPDTSAINATIQGTKDTCVRTLTTKFFSTDFTQWANPPRVVEQAS